MKKVALCLHGYYNNRANINSGTEGFEYIRDTILSRTDFETDVFIHSWEPTRRQQLIELYSPKEIITENQVDFSIMMAKEGITQEHFDEGFNRSQSKFAACNIESTLSFLYSREKAINLSTKGDYECVITARFDLGQRDKQQKRKYHVSTMNFDPNLDMNYFYSAMWDQLNAGYADQWFFSSQSNMIILKEAFTYAIDCFRANSAYEASVTGGWFDSRKIDNLSSTDPAQFTNEKLKCIKKGGKLMKYPRWQCVNNHLLYKWIIREMKLYEVSKFI